MRSFSKQIIDWSLDANHTTSLFQTLNETSNTKRKRPVYRTLEKTMNRARIVSRGTFSYDSVEIVCFMDFLLS
ncbi:unnamed protein product [Auanema sp. JU1783]|nr:unnamed protein product [Auanema sp. JU1783]